MSKAKKESKTEKWLSIAEKVIFLIRPKFHNTITKVVVLFGLTLSVESQVNIIEAFAVAFFEYFFGPSEFLRGLFSGSSNPWIGVIFVIFGLIYNAIITIGLELIQKYKAAIPKVPFLLFSLKNADDIDVEKETVFRGKRCTVPDNNEIPDNNCYSKFAQERMEKEGKYYPIGRVAGTRSTVMGRMIGPFDKKVNKDFYRERAAFLKVWGGAEILSLYLFNKGEILCKNIKVEVKIPRKSGISADSQNNLTPESPDQETEGLLSRYDLPNTNIPSYDIKRDHNHDNFIFVWDVGNLQAKATASSKTKIFFRSEIETLIEIKISCDELTKPVEISYTAKPAPDEIKVDLASLELKGSEFSKLVNEVIMDGYVRRHLKRKFEEINRKENSLVP